MVIETLIASLALTQPDWPSQATLRVGEVMRSYEKTMSRSGTYERTLVLTPKKAFLNEGGTRRWTMLTPAQQAELKIIFSKEPDGLRSRNRSNPMWPSAYDGTDQWVAYRVGKAKRTWTNKEYEGPTDQTRLSKFVDAIKSQLAPTLD